MSPVVGLLHPGRMGVFLAVRMRARGATVLWCSDGRSGETAARAREAGLLPVRTMADLVERATIVVSVCPPAAAESVAATVVRNGYRGLFVEANSISPTRFTAIQDRLSTNRITVVDAAVVGPPPGPTAVERVYLAGGEVPVRRVADLFPDPPGDAGVEVVDLGRPAGAASALKAAHVTYQRGARALAALSLALADRHDVAHALLAEAERRPRSALTEPEHLSRVAARAARGVAELTEAADALRAAGLPADLAVATGEVFRAWAGLACRPGIPLSEVLAGLGDLADRPRPAVDAGEVVP
jgi:3-hydroxyisobutyrate dehydrogenase-like beta-hydroxyacid dehydrogenase